jgi:hypothetical protein
VLLAYSGAAVLLQQLYNPGSSPPTAIPTAAQQRRSTCCYVRIGSRKKKRASAHSVTIAFPAK